MKILIHKNAEFPLEVITDGEEIISLKSKTCAGALLELAERFPEELLGWCEESLMEFLPKENWKFIFHHDLIMASFNCSDNFYIPSEIGYVEDSPFINVKKNVSYPTWLMSSDVGGIHASVLSKMHELPVSQNFPYFLNSIAKLSHLQGLLCYSEPGLVDLDKAANVQNKPASKYTLFRFIKQHYKTQWMFILFLNILIYERKFPVLPLIYGMVFKKYNRLKFNFDIIKTASTRVVFKNGSLDVIIPTIGRKKAVYDVLCDLRAQTYLPRKVIVIEQNPNPESSTELDFIRNEIWPFKVDHIFTHQTGVCNARNLGVEKVESEWVFFNDDDNRLKPELLYQIVENIKSYGVYCYTTPYLREGDSIKNKNVNQSTVFGSGNSLLSSAFLKGIKFSKELEHGYGEDIDFGRQIRNAGADVIHFPFPAIQHLKLPVGGFRDYEGLEWKKKVNKIEPSPTIMWSKKKHLTVEQFRAYKIYFFISQIKKRRFNLIELNRRWKRSLDWSGNL